MKRKAFLLASLGLACTIAMPSCKELQLGDLANTLIQELQNQDSGYETTDTSDAATSDGTYTETSEYDASGVPVYGYSNGQAVYGYDASNQPVYDYRKLTPTCIVPQRAPLPRAHFHYPTGIRQAPPPSWHKLDARPPHRPHHHPGFGGPKPPFGKPGFGGPKPPFGAKPGFGGPKPPFGAKPGFGGPKPPFGAKPGFGGPKPPFGAKPGFGGAKPPFGAKPGFGGPKPPFGGAKPGFGGPKPPFGGAKPGAKPGMPFPHHHKKPGSSD